MPFQWQTREPQNIGQMIELMMAPARAKARAAEVRGQANASALGAAGNAAAGTIGAVMENRATAPQRAMQARSMQLDLQAKERDAALTDQAGQAAKDFSTWVSSSPTLPTPEQVVGRYGPELGPRFVNVLKMIHPDAEPMVVNPGDTVIDKRNPGAAPLYTAPAKPDLMEVGGTVIDKNQPGAGPVYTAPEKAPTAGSFEDYVRRGAQEQGKTVAQLKPADIEGFRKKYQQADDRPQINVSMNADDSEAIADAIVSGDQPPTLQGLYRNGAQVRAALAKKGFNLSQATIDWQATSKHLATLNGAQQTRMRQAVDNAAHSLDVIEDLASQWDGGKFPLLNKAALASAKQGALGAPAQEIATQLEAQISDVTSELGNVYMGGNSPTDHALSLAGKNLSADWTKAQLISALNLARKNLQIRSNSMKNVGPAGASASNPYAAPESPASAPGADPLGILK